MSGVESMEFLCYNGSDWRNTGHGGGRYRFAAGGAGARPTGGQ